MWLSAVALAWIMFAAAPRAAAPQDQRPALQQRDATASVAEQIPAAAARYVGQGDAALDHGNLQQARDDYRKADEKAQHQCVACLLRLASVDRSLSDLGHAEDAAQKAVEAAHGRPGLLAAAEEALGDLLSARAGSEHPKLHLLQQAVQAFRSGLAAAPAGAIHNQLQFKLAVVLLRARKDAEAKALLAALPATPGVDATVAKQARAIAADPHLAFEEMPPEFAVSASDGHVYSNENLRGKVVLLDFWGSWCLPCRDSEPMMVSIYKTFAQQPGFRMLGIDVGDTPRNMEEFVASHHMRWPQIQDRTGGLTREFGAGVVPMYILIRRDGSAELVTEGLDFVEAGRISGETQYALEQAIRQALKQPVPVPQ